jgi:hypothetical protein
VFRILVHLKLHSSGAKRLNRLFGFRKWAALSSPACLNKKLERVRHWRIPSLGCNGAPRHGLHGRAHFTYPRAVRPCPLHDRPVICCEPKAPYRAGGAWNAPAFNHHCQAGPARHRGGTSFAGSFFSPRGAGRRVTRHVNCQSYRVGLYVADHLAHHRTASPSIGKWQSNRIVMS